MSTFTCNSHDGSRHTVLGSRAVFWVCGVLILCPFGLFIWTPHVAAVSSNFAQGVCSTIFVLADRFPCVSDPVCLCCVGSLVLRLTHGLQCWLRNPQVFRSNRRSFDSRGQVGKCLFLFTNHQIVRFRTNPVTAVSSPTDVEPSSLFRGGIQGVFCATLMNLQTHFLVLNTR